MDYGVTMRLSWFFVTCWFPGDDGGRWCGRDTSGLAVEGVVGVKPRRENGVLEEKTSKKTEKKMSCSVLLQISSRILPSFCRVMFAGSLCAAVSFSTKG